MKLKKLFLAFTVLTVLLFAVVLELGRNTLYGWFLLVGVTAAAFALHVRFSSQKKWFVRLPLFLVYLIALAAVFLITQPRPKLIPAVDVKNPAVTGVVHVAEGDLTGVYTEDGSVEVYAGVPYAAPPVGDLRWKEPQPAEPWQGVRACDTFAPKSMQSDSLPIVDSLTRAVGYHTFRVSLDDNYVDAMSEDSLYLNIWKPAGSVSGLPVLFFIHGGSLTGGNTWYSEYNGVSLAKRGVIVVNCAYRLGVFGYYANDLLAAESPNGTTGNYGLLDQIAALRWVHDNIAFFGGDAGNVTIAGESAGSSSVNAICVSPLAKGLFRRAIGESSGVSVQKPYHTFRAYESAVESGRKVMEEFGASTLEELRAIPAEQLVGTRYTPSAMTVDGFAITEQPWLTYEKGNQNEEALLNGFNVHEAEFFSFGRKVTSENYVDSLRGLLGDHAEAAAALYPPAPLDPDYTLAIVEQGGDAKGAYDSVLSACWFTYSHDVWSRQDAAGGRPVYLYRFTKHNGSLGNAHGGEMPYAYGNLDAHAWLYDETDYVLSDVMQEYWVNFAKSGDPNGEGLPRWERFNDDPARIMELGENVGMTEAPYLELYKLIDAYMGAN